MMAFMFLEGLAVPTRHKRVKKVRLLHSYLRYIYIYIYAYCSISDFIVLGH